MEERKVVEKRTRVEHEEKPAVPGTRNINVGPDGSTQIQEDVVEEPVEDTVVREETVVKEERRP